MNQYIRHLLSYNNLYSRLNLFSFFLLGLSVFHFFFNLLWLRLNKNPLPWDQAGHTLLTFKYVDYFMGQIPEGLLKISDYYPPFVHLITSLIMLAVGTYPVIGGFVVTLFFVLAIIFLYLYTYELFHDEVTAIFGVLFFSFLPWIVNLSHSFLLEIPLISLVLGSLFFLEKSVNFSSKKYVAVSAIFLGLALLTKWTAILFFILPALTHIGRSRVSINNLLYFFIIVFLIIIAWYGTNIEAILNYGQVTLTGEKADPQVLLSWENVKYYIYVLINFQLTWIGFVFFVIGLILSLINIKRFPKIVLLNMLLIYLIFTFISNKDSRYTILLPVYASMIVGFFVSKLIKFNTVIASILLYTISIFFIGYYFSLFFGVPFHPKKVDFQRAINLPAIGWVDYINLGKDTSQFLGEIYGNDNWLQNLVLNYISKREEVYVNMLVLIDKKYFNSQNLEIARRLGGVNNLMISAPYAINRFTDEASLEGYLSNFKYVLITRDELGKEEVTRNYDVFKILRDEIQKEKDTKAFKIGEFVLPDGDMLEIYETHFKP